MGSDAVSRFDVGAGLGRSGAINAAAVVVGNVVVGDVIDEVTLVSVGVGANDSYGGSVLKAGTEIVPVRFLPLPLPLEDCMRRSFL